MVQHFHRRYWAANAGVGGLILCLVLFVPMCVVFAQISAQISDLSSQEIVKEIQQRRETGRKDSDYVRLLLTASQDLNLPDRAPSFVAEARSLYQSFHSPTLEADFFYAAGMLARAELRTKDAADTLRLALDRYVLLGEKHKTALTYSRLGLLFHQMGLYESAIEYHVTALTLAEEIGYTEIIFRQSINLAHLSSALNKPRRALNLLAQAEKNMLPNAAIQRKTALYQYRAEAYMLLGNLDSALRCLNQAFMFAHQSPYRDTLTLAFLYGNYAMIAQKQGNSILSQQMLDSALVLERLLAFNHDNVRLPMDAARVLLLRAEQEANPVRKTALYRTSLGYANSALALPINVRLYRLMLLETMASSYAALGDFLQANRVQRSYVALRDSLFSFGLEAHFSSIAERIARNKRESEVEHLTIENRARTRLQYAFAATALVLAVLIVVLWNRYRLKQRSKATVETMNAELHNANLQLQQANMLLNHANDELSLARERASEVDTMKRAFIDMISHEIRTPLTAIHGYSDIFLMELTDNDHRDFAERIRASSKHLLLLFEDMLHLSKMRGDQIDLDLELVSIHEVCRQIIAMFESATQEKGITLKLEVSSSLVQHLLLDTAKVRLIIFNLVGNAVKFTEKGGVTLSVVPIPNPQESEITAETGMMTGICITVHDTGIGMPEEALKHIFESFRQTNVDIHRKYGGLGLGLTICKAFADAMGGNITAESVQGEGSTFRVVIPISHKEISNAQ